jgi:hypothetical protein
MNSEPREKTDRALAEWLVSALSSLPGIEVQWKETQSTIGPYEVDLVVNADVHGKPVQFLVELKSSGYPRDVRDAVSNMDKVREFVAPTVAPATATSMFVAPVISESSRELLRENGIASWDTSGSLSLDLPWAHYLIDRPAPKQPERVLRDVYQGSSAQVLHALLLDPDRSWHLNELARESEVAVSTVHKVCTFLERQLWMEQEGKGPRSVRILREPGALLDAWASAHSLERYDYVRFHRWTRDRAILLEALSPALAARDVAHALTLESGASLVAPYALPSDQVWIIVPWSALGRVEDVATQAGLRRVDEGERVTFMATRDHSPLLCRREIDGIWVASDVQLYLDLWAWPMRGQEQARHLRSEQLPY